jgi:hypothetical protein
MPGFVVDFLSKSPCPELHLGLSQARGALDVQDESVCCRDQVLTCYLSGWCRCRCLGKLSHWLLITDSLLTCHRKLPLLPSSVSSSSSRTRYELPSHYYILHALTGFHPQPWMRSFPVGSQSRTHHLSLAQYTVHTSNGPQDEMLKTGRLDRKYSGIMDAFSRTAKNEGVMALWRGNTANVIR